MYDNAQLRLQQAKVSLGVGVLSTVIVLAVLFFGNIGAFGVYVIAGVSSVLMSLRALIFIPLYSAHLLKQKWYVFYPSIIRGWLAFFANLIVFVIVNSFVTINSWLVFCCICLIVGIAGYAFSIPIMFSKSEITQLKNKLMKKIKR